MLQLAPYLEQLPSWPTKGRHILAQYDDSTVVVYQAFRPAIALEATRLGKLGPSFSRSRMSWIKPNFLWMMYRCGWATKEDQERVLAIRIRREFFERILRAAVPSSFAPELYVSREAWSEAVKTSNVRLQWDPDHNPAGAPQDRRALQLGLRGALLAEYANQATVGVEDVTNLVTTERANARAPYSSLTIPLEKVLVPTEAAIKALGLDRVGDGSSTVDR